MKNEMMIILHLILHSAVHIYDFHIFITSSSSFHGFITNQFNNLLPVGLLADTDISEVKGFFFFFFHSFIGCSSGEYNIKL